MNATHVAPECVHCASDNTVPITYGTVTGEIETLLDSELTWHGGEDHQVEGDYTWHCYDCHGDY